MTISMNLFVDGPKGGGKSALVMRDERDIFIEEYDEDYGGGAIRTITLNRGDKPPIDVKIDITDPGPVEYKDRYFQVSLGTAVVYSVTSRDSFNELENAVQHLYEVSWYLQPPGPMVLVASKCDLIGERQVTSAEGIEFAKRHGMTYIEISAKTGRNVEHVFYDLASIIEFQMYQDKGKTRKHPPDLPIDQTYEGIPSYVPKVRLYVDDDDFSKPPPLIQIPDSAYVRDMKQLRDEQDFADLFFIVKNSQEKISAHKFIVYSRCDKIQQIVDDSSSPTIVNVLWCGQTTLELFLDFVYTASMDIPEKEISVEAPLLLILAREWGLDDLHKFISKQYPSFVEKHVDNNQEVDFVFNLQQNLRKFLSYGEENSKKHFDVKFNLKDSNEESIFAHKALLACRSPYFRAMFTGGTKEKHEREIDIFEFSFSAFFATLEFCYTDSITCANEDIASDLLISSNKLCLGRLKTLTASFIATEMNWDNILKMYRLAVTADSQPLIEFCSFYIIRTLDKLESTHEDFSILSKEEIESFREQRKNWPDIDELEKHWYEEITKNDSESKIANKAISCGIM